LPWPITRITATFFNNTFHSVEYVNRDYVVKKITAIEVQKKNSKRVNIFLDGEFAFGLSCIVAAWLELGQSLSDEKIVELKIQDEQEIAYQRALRITGYRSRSTFEIKRHLRKLNFSQNIIAAVLNRLEHAGILDDRQFAKLWVENRVEFRPRSHRMLTLELRQKGIKDDIIKKTLETTTPDGDLAYKAALKQKSKYNNLEWQDFRRKLSAYLYRRGFNYETITPIVKRVWVERDTKDQLGL
jgi:regulatory protein